MVLSHRSHCWVCTYLKETLSSTVIMSLQEQFRPCTLWANAPEYFSFEGDSALDQLEKTLTSRYYIYNPPSTLEPEGSHKAEA